MRLHLRGTAAPAHRRSGHVATIAHRGASSEAPENTLAAVRRAVQLGADMVEVDVQRTRDGVLVLMHDATLTRTTDAALVFPDRAPWSVADFSYAELRRLDAGAWMDRRFAGEPVPTLLDVLRLLHGTATGLLLEVKRPDLHPGVVADVVSTLHLLPGVVERALSGGRLVVQSFDVAAMKEHKTRAPEVPVGILGAPARENLPALATWADLVNPHHLGVGSGYVRALQEEGMRCLTWTVDGGPAMRRAVALGVDGIITNHPARLSARLAARLGDGTVGRTQRWLPSV